MGKIRPIGSDEVMQELQEISTTLAAIPKVNPFTVPDVYFDGLNHTVALSREEQLPSENPFKVPMGYFDELHDRITEQLTGHPVLLSETLAGLREKQPFKTPEDYFQALPGAIGKRVTHMRPVKVRKLVYQFRVVAVAAALVGIILMVVPFLHRQPVELATPSRDAVSAYLLANLDAFTDAEIAAFIGDEALLDLASNEVLINETDLNNYLLDEVDYYQLEDEWL